jgi:UDP-glucuronate 4-epimerase
MTEPTYLVTGAHGFIGAWVVKKLLAQRQRVVIFDKSPDPQRLRLIMDDEEIAQATFVAGDICDEQAVTGLIQEYGITNIIHLAGVQVPVCRANPRLGAMINVIGTINIFEAARQSQGQVKLRKATRPKRTKRARWRRITAPSNAATRTTHASIFSITACTASACDR